jgi:hypothetical protein
MGDAAPGGELKLEHKQPSLKRVISAMEILPEADWNHIRFENEDREYRLHMAREDWQAMGMPQAVVVTVVPGKDVDGS